MKNVYKNISKKISQGGSMMIEAMAMLALIALVTPTLYKKSAERTTELQDINTATHVRTLTKAIDNYVSANYQELLEGDLNNADGIHIMDLTDASGNINDSIAPYLPFGYKFDELKNFDKPKVALKKQTNGNEVAITAFVQFPKKTDIGEMRSARIASMIGSNGGYVDGNSSAKGVGGVWELGTADLESFNFDTNKGSVVVASSEAINSATSGALENEKYLQRTKVENENEKWRNTMSTDLYMGGVSGPDANTSNMHRILGVEQLIIGATETDKDFDLVLDDNSNNGGSAYLAGDFSAADNLFQIAKDTDELLFGTDGDTIYAKAGDSVDFFSDGTDTSVSFTQDAATINVATSINSTLGVTGATSLVTDGDGEFSVGPNGEYIKAQMGEVSLLNDAVTTKAGSEGVNNLTSINTDLLVTGPSNFDQSVKIGTEKLVPAKVENPILNVQGNAYVSKKLEVGETIITNELDLLNLRAGGKSLNSDKRWLHATESGVKVIDINKDLNPERLVIDNTTTQLFNGASKLDLSDNDAILQAGEEVYIYSEITTGQVNLQNGAIILDKKPGDNSDNNVNINATNTTVNTGLFEVVRPNEDPENKGNQQYFSVNTADSTTQIFTKNTDITSQRLDISNNALLQVRPTGYDGTDAESGNRAVVGIDKDEFVVTAGLNTYDSDTGEATWGEELREILRVDVSDTEPKDYDTGNIENGASVYIRRGALELESSKEVSKTKADEGLGYVEASRFVSNATGGNENVVVPMYSGDYAGGPDPINGGTAQSSIYYNGGKINPDRYMVNPAYTSVMHDIKLTTRGGARLSDILPDFINKGIYVVNNTYKDNLNVENLKGVVTGSLLNQQVGVVGAEEIDMSKDLTGPDRWASPFLGVVPSPQCPPGHARVITLTPAGFRMGDTGNIVKAKARNPYTGNDNGYRFVVENNPNYNKLDEDTANALSEDETLNVPNYDTLTFSTQVNSQTSDYEINYLGYNNKDGNQNKHILAQPIYFQQSTWLKSKVIPQAKDVTGACNDYGKECGENFIGWSAIMGFIYPRNEYGTFIDYVNGSQSLDNDYYWNIFPVKATTLEAYATVYCYFDRTNIYDSGLGPDYVDQYDQLNNFRGGYKKEEDSDASKKYIGRLNDPTLVYDNPW